MSHQCVTSPSHQCDGDTHLGGAEGDGDTHLDRAESDGDTHLGGAEGDGGTHLGRAEGDGGTHLGGAEGDGVATLRTLDAVARVARPAAVVLGRAPYQHCRVLVHKLHTQLLRR